MLVDAGDPAASGDFRPDRRASADGGLAERPPQVVEDAGGIVTITLIRPDRSNALDEPLLGALKRLLEGLIGQSQPRVVVLTGSGRAFCAGADISVIKGMTDKGEIARIFAPQGEVIGSLVGEVAELLFSPRLISIAAVNGSAIGGGWLLALACDTAGLPSVRGRGWLRAIALTHPFHIC